MTPRLYAAIVCMFAARRWPILGVVALALGLEHVAPTLALYTATHGATIASSLAWAAPSILMSSLGSSFGTRPVRAALAMACMHVVATVSSSSSTSQILTTFAACFVASCLLLTRTRPCDLERSVVLVLLVGNTATSALTMFVGTEHAYQTNVVVTSNNAVHLAVVGLVLWAMRSR